MSWLLLQTGMVIAFCMAAYLAVQWLARRFARAHPEFGPYEERREGCCGSCMNACDKGRPHSD